MNFVSTLVRGRKTTFFSASDLRLPLPRVGKINAETVRPAGRHMTVVRSAELVRHRSGATGSFRSVNSRRGGIHLPALIGVGGGLLLSVQFTRSFIIPARSASQKEHCSVRRAFRRDSANKYQYRLIDADWFGFH